MIEYSADLIFMLDADGIVVSINPATERLLGSRLGGRVDDLLVRMIHPDDMQLSMTTLTEAYNRPGLNPPFTFRIATRTGGWVYLTAVCNNQLGDPAVAGMIFNARDVSTEVHQLQQIRRNQQALAESLSRVAEFRDPYTAGHQRTVAALTRRIAENLEVDNVDAITLGAALHDIGKIAVPAEILSRPGLLSAAEFDIVKSHVRVGYDIVRDADLPADVADVVLHHHERLDGSGYPEGLAGDQIGIGPRIAAVADVIDAMTSHRPYRPGLGILEARSEITDNSGRLYDPAVVAAALAETAPLLDGSGALWPI